MENAVVKMQNITKIYGNGIAANIDACIEVKRGEIHALAGENGAGKSTLMKILFGIEEATSGEIFIKGEKVKITSPHIAYKHKIGMVHQHFMLIDDLTVAENIILGIEKTKNGFLDRAGAIEFTKKLSQEYDMPLNPLDKISSLSVVQKQKVEILKVLAREAEVIILDEPTAVLTPQETQRFFAQLLLLKSKGYTVIIITHKLKEIKQICDTITVMRNGRHIATAVVADMTEEEISRLMVGRDVIKNVEKSPLEAGEEYLTVKGLNKTLGQKFVLKDINFSCRKGEIVTLAGVEGNGQKEIVDIVTGFDKDYYGEVAIEEKDVKKFSVKGIRDLGEAHIPEDRLVMGVDVSSSIEENLISCDLNSSLKWVFTDGKKIRDNADKCISSYEIKCENGLQSVGMLSGGNMQKVVVARETVNNPKLLIANQPTRGVDVGAIECIHNKIVSLRRQGCAILLVSSDLAEVFALSDRILVLHGGEIVGSLNNGKELTEEELGLYMLGLKRQEGAKA